MRTRNSRHERARTCVTLHNREVLQMPGTLDGEARDSEAAPGKSWVLAIPDGACVSGDKWCGLDHYRAVKDQ
ncbi:hypothetical protein P8C59_005622 [Phyllachora maydis]|uniref:Uncharacterized protein n=1 Tax=Phyllachora maydis TaxID=1825666 RepID=A0AAD9MEP2_9PEZI|nr:hypothetical protein P8C59_005622 [Phyllachora maydis]